MYTFMLRDLLRHPVRTGLTVLGISLGIATVVAFSIVTQSAEETTLQVLDTGNYDFVLVQRHGGSIFSSTITEETWHTVARRPDIDLAAGVLFLLDQVDDNPYFRIAGVPPDQLQATQPPMVAGRTLATDAKDEALLGERAASQLGAKVGERVTLGGQAFTVVGIFKTGHLWQDSGAIVPLATIQAATGRQGLLNLVYLRLKPGADLQTVAKDIEGQYPYLRGVSGSVDYLDLIPTLQVVSALNVGVSVLAIVIGGLGVLNTLATTVTERTREIGILRALGWSGARVLGLIVGESLMMCLMAAVVGSLIGVVAVRLVLLDPTLSSLIELSYPPDVFAKAIGIAFGVAAAGAAYPAARAVRFRPAAALAYE